MANVAKWRKFSKEEIQKIVEESYSFRQVCEKLGYAPDSGNISRIKNVIINYFNFDVSHFLGQGWNKKNYNYNKFNYNEKYRKGKNSCNPLIELRGRKCENCGLEEWQGKPINLQVHHIDGDRKNNSLENLQLLCPNCHSYTDNFCKKNRKEKINENDFLKALLENNSIKLALEQLNITPCGGNYERAWDLIYKYDIKHLKK